MYSNVQYTLVHNYTDFCEFFLAISGTGIICIRDGGGGIIIKCKLVIARFRIEQRVHSLVFQTFLLYL